MLHIVDHPYSTGAPGIIGVAIPAATRGRLKSPDVELRQQVLLVMDDNIALRQHNDPEAQEKKPRNPVPFSKVAEWLLQREKIPVVRIPVNFDRLTAADKIGDGGGIVDAATDVLSALIGHRHVGLLVPVEHAEKAIRLLSSPEKLQEDLNPFHALSYRGSATSLFAGPQCSMDVSEAFLPKPLAVAILRDLDNLRQLRSDFDKRQQGM